MSAAAIIGYWTTWYVFKYMRGSCNVQHVIPLYILPWLIGRSYIQIDPREDIKCSRMVHLSSASCTLVHFQYKLTALTNNCTNMKLSYDQQLRVLIIHAHQTTSWDNRCVQTYGTTNRRVVSVQCYHKLFMVQPLHYTGYTSAVGLVVQLTIDVCVVSLIICFCWKPLCGLTTIIL